MYFRSLPLGCYGTYGPRLIALMVEGNIADYLSLERAEILHSMSLFLLKGFLPEKSRLFRQLPFMCDILVAVQNTF